MKHKITFLHTTEYCLLQPSDKECQYTKILEADTKTEAIMKYHQDAGMVRNQRQYATTPIVWSVEVL